MNYVTLIREFPKLYEKSLAVKNKRKWFKKNQRLDCYSQIEMRYCYFDEREWVSG